MNLNPDKMNMILFNNSKTMDFMPEFYIGDQEIKFVEKLNLLGVTMTSDLKWNEKTNVITKKSL